MIVTVASGQSVSSAFALGRGGRALTVFVPSHAPVAWRATFSPTSGGPTFFPLVTPGTAATPVWSGATPGAFTIEFPPTPWGRIETSSATMSAVSLQLFSVAR